MNTKPKPTYEPERGGEKVETKALGPVEILRRFQQASIAAQTPRASS